MPDITAIAERLRKVRKAHQRFLGLWAAEHLAAKPASLDRVVDDIARHSERPARGGRAQSTAPGTDDGQNRRPFASGRWSVLYRGSILDD